MMYGDVFFPNRWTAATGGGGGSTDAPGGDKTSWYMSAGFRSVVFWLATMFFGKGL
jgi:hypothetical protein